MKRKPRIAIVGAGNLASAIAVSLRHAHFPIDAIVSRSSRESLRRARILARNVGARAIMPEEELNADVIWFCVPDSQIVSAAREIAKRREWRGTLALHSSGALSSDALEAFRKQRAVIASAHPLMTFVKHSRPPLAEVPWAIEGDAVGVRAARRIVRDLGGHPFSIRKSEKPAYHAWGTFASPLLTALLATTEQVAALAGVKGKAAARRMLPILKQTLANYAEFGASRGLSGPIVRGDAETVRSHLRVLVRSPKAREVYVALARASVAYLPGKRKGELTRLLNSA